MPVDGEETEDRIENGNEDPRTGDAGVVVPDDRREARAGGVKPAVARPEVALLVGLPGSGKTTFFLSRLAATHEHVSKDLYPRSSNRARRQAAQIEAALATGRSIVVDNTNVSPAERAPVIAAARRHGARVIGYYFDVPVGTCVGRNRAREGRTRVPDVAIFAAAKRLTPPALAEGFDELITVSEAQT